MTDTLTIYEGLIILSFFTIPLLALLFYSGYAQVDKGVVGMWDARWLFSIFLILFILGWVALSLIMGTPEIVMATDFWDL